MKFRFPVAAATLLFLTSFGAVYGQSRVQYVIQINHDGSASWVIKQTGIDILPSTPEQLQRNLTLLSEVTWNKIGRTVNASVTLITYNSTFQSSYTAIEYWIHWTNFSRVENSSITVGDVFQVKDFFAQLFGEGELELIYPPEYMTVEPVLPQPHERDDLLQTLRWYGTQDFIDQVPVIGLQKRPTTFFDMPFQNLAFVLGLVLAAGGSSICFYVFKLRKKKHEMATKPVVPAIIESSEESIVRALAKAGGSLCQSTIADQCKFSKAKTSQLLAVMEKKGMVARYKRGRDKIVNLLEDVEGK